MLQGRSNVYRKGKKFHVLLMKDAGRAFVRNISLIPCNIYLFLFLLLFVFLLPKTNNKKKKNKKQKVPRIYVQVPNMQCTRFFTVGFLYFVGQYPPSLFPLQFRKQPASWLLPVSRFFFPPKYSSVCIVGVPYLSYFIYAEETRN